ncbi:mitochondrial protein [Daedalea quercina L-15889]|uniref:trimethyllysine dioxygenase n=1 Tax=Daedalea quercina L-15889 TaxID=1314783 RepID=A0A165TJ63_9APHY|nr:mitochondrial protein [Daedalea quercina L-15889]
MWRSTSCLRLSAVGKRSAPSILEGATVRRSKIGRYTYSRAISTTTTPGLIRGHGSTRQSSAAAALKPVQETHPEHHEQNSSTLGDLPTSRIDDRKVVVGWDAQTWSRYHHIWLRDHCRCPQCFHPVTKQRLVNTFEIPFDVKPVAVESKPEGLDVTWPSTQPHISFYPWSWLQQNSYDPPLARAPPPEKILWGSKILQDPPTVTYEEAMSEDERGLFKWLSNTEKFGFCFISGVPPTPEATEELSRRIGFIRETQYGTFWDFTSDLAKGDTAYTTLALGAHTDTTYYTDPCGLQLFHLLEHSGGSGGATLLVDGFYVASILKELHPTAYDLLARVRVPSHAAGEPSALYTPTPRSGYPVLRHSDGELIQVRWNNDDRSVVNHLEPGMVEEWYDAIKKWHQLLTSADSEYWIQLSPGTAVVVDNHRVLHGRSAFTGKRRMCGAYIGVDEYRSKLAVLGEKFAPDSVVQETSAYATVNGRSIWNMLL